MAVEPPLKVIRQLRQLTEREKECVLEVWTHVESDYVAYGQGVFSELFTRHPNYKRFFLDMLEGEDDLLQSPRFQNHMIQVLMPTIGGVIHHLDHPEAVQEAMKRVGVQHLRKEVGLHRENVETMRQAILCTLRRNITDMTEQQARAVDKILDILFQIFSDSLEGKL